MAATLQQIQFKLSEVRDLRRDALDTVRLLALGRIEADKDMRVALVSKFDGYEREFWALAKVERQIISSGTVNENELRVLSAPGASAPVSATVTLANSCDALEAPREAPRNETSAASLPAAGEVF